MPTQYQHLSLVKPVRITDAGPTPGVVIDNPTSTASDEELAQFQLQFASLNLNGKPHSIDITPPLFRKLRQRGGVKKVPYELFWETVDRSSRNSDYDPDRSREDYVHLSQNTEFIPLTNLSVGYHKTDEQGGGYRVASNGAIHFPVCYFASTDGYVISCRIMALTANIARRHIREGTGDVIAKRVKLKGLQRRCQYFVRVFKVLASTQSKEGYRQQDFYDCTILSNPKKTRLHQVILATFVGPRPYGYIGQHDGD